MAGRAALGLVALVLLSACAGGGGTLAPLPPPPTTRPLAPTTVPPDYTGVGLPGVPGGRTTTTSLVMGPGKAKLTGRVVGPDGAPVPAAVVRVERVVREAAAGVDLTSAEDGTWSVADVLGGGYRVRAWRPPDLAMVEPAYVFLGATDNTTTLEVKLGKYYGTTPAPSIAPNPPVALQQASLVVQVTSRSVDAAGVVQGVPMAGVAVALTEGTGWSVAAPNPTVTDLEGRARWEISCLAPGPQSLRLVVGGTEPFQLSLPACAEPPTPAPPSSAPSSSMAPKGSTTTTRPATTTTTTRPLSTTTTTRPLVTTTTTRRP